jgi:hypothetical protein
MDVKAWMREQLHSGAFAAVDDVKAAELARAARVAFRLPKPHALQCDQWAAEVLAEPRSPQSEGAPAAAQGLVPANTETETERRARQTLLRCYTILERIGKDADLAGLPDPPPEAQIFRHLSNPAQ